MAVAHAQIDNVLEDADNYGYIWHTAVQFTNGLGVWLAIETDSDGRSHPYQYRIYRYDISIETEGYFLPLEVNCSDNSVLADYMNYLIDINEEAIIDLLVRDWNS